MATDLPERPDNCPHQDWEPTCIEGIYDCLLCGRMYMQDQNSGQLIEVTQEQYEEWIRS